MTTNPQCVTTTCETNSLQETKLGQTFPIDQKLRLIFTYQMWLAVTNVLQIGHKWVTSWTQVGHKWVTHVPHVNNKKAGFKRLQFPVTASHSAAGIPLVYINNFIQIWCGAPFYSMPCGLNFRRMYLKPHGLPFELSSRKYSIWIILLHSNTNDSRSGFQ